MKMHDHETAEVKEALLRPPFVTNRFAVMWGDQSIRIAFGDKPAVDFPTSFHTHIALNHEDACALIELLERMKSQHEAKSATKN